MKKRTLLKAGAMLILAAMMSATVMTTVSAATGGGDLGVAAGATATYTTLSDDEVAGLTYMREEEKLARDVYLTLYDTWGDIVFSNIARSEQQHTDAVKYLLDLYGVSDPVVDDSVGVFTNPDLQALYGQLVEQGEQSLEAALQVGATIEEIDILDLEEWLEKTDNANIITVFQNLERGSDHHLQAFVSRLEAVSGQTYTPQYLSQEQYDAIIGGTIGYGYRGGMMGYGARPGLGMAPGTGTVPGAGMWGGRGGAWGGRGARGAWRINGGAMGGRFGTFGGPGSCWMEP